MKIAASDFDGTLFREQTISREDREAIRRWRAAGHVFGIVTGRGREMLLQDAAPFAVPCDFLVCNNGADVYGADARSLYRAPLPKGVADILLKHPGAAACRLCVFFAGPSFYGHAEKTSAWIVKNVSLPLLPPQELARLPGVHQISLAYAEPEQAEAAIPALSRSLKGKAALHRSGVCIDITAPDVSKAAGMEHLLMLRRWETAEVLVIGDAGNDVPMIRRFGGYAVDNAGQEIRETAKGVYPSVGHMLLEHL